MRIWRQASLLVLTLTFLSPAFSQNKIDSLISLVKTEKDDSDKVSHLNTICKEYSLIGEFDKSLLYGKKAFEIASTISVQAKLKDNIAIYLSAQRGLALAANNIGTTFKEKGNYPEALKNYFISLKIREELKDKKGIAMSYNNIGLIYMDENDYSNALKNYFAALKLFEELNFKQGIASVHLNMGLIYGRQNKSIEAVENFSSSLKTFEELGFAQGVAYCHMCMGNVYSLQGKFTEAGASHATSLKIRKEMGDKGGIAECYTNLGGVYIKQGNLQEAKNYLNKAIELSAEIGDIHNLKESYLSFSKLDSITGSYKDAFTHHKLYIAYRDSLLNEETKKKSLEASMQYEFDKKEIVAKAEQEKLDAINIEEKQQQRIVIFAVAGVLLLVVIFSVFLFNRFRITQRQKAVIEKQKVLVDNAYESLHEKNKEVMDSIYYASRIQKALITNENYIHKNLNRLNKN